MWLHLLCRVVISLFLRKGAVHVLLCVFSTTRMSLCANVCVKPPTVSLCVLCLPLSMAQLSRLLPPGSAGKVRHPPTQQRAGTEGGGRQVDPFLLMKEHELTPPSSLQIHPATLQWPPAPVPLALSCVGFYGYCGDP